jgi:hypothetical protein
VADLGWHRLKDIAGAEHLYQLLIPGLPDTFPPLKSLGNRGSLPGPATPFIARSAELRDVQGLLAGADAVRLVTVTGPGGGRTADASGRRHGGNRPGRDHEGTPPHTRCEGRGRQPATWPYAGERCGGVPVMDC